jgi:zinc-ribbon domain
MICPNCGAENAEGAPFCYNCANPLPQPGASVPPGGMPPGGVPPPGVPPPGAMPPGSVPPGGAMPPQWPGGGGPPYTPEPPRPPRNTLSAGLGALIAFLVVAGIGALLFFTVFKKENAPPPPPPPPSVTTSPSPIESPSAVVSPSPIESPSVVASPSKTNNGGGGGGRKFRNVVRIFFCKKLIGGTVVGGTIVGATPSGCSNPVQGGVNIRRTVPGFIVMVSALDFEPKHTIQAAVGIPGTRVIVQEGSFTTTGVAGSQRAFLPVLAPRGGFPPVTLAVVVLIDRQPVQFQSGGRNIVPEVNLR